MQKELQIGKYKVVVFEVGSVDLSDQIVQLFAEKTKVVVVRREIVRRYSSRSDRRAYVRDGRKSDVSVEVYCKTMTVLDKVKAVAKELHVWKEADSRGLFHATNYGSGLIDVMRGVQFALRGFSIERCTGVLDSSVILQSLGYQSRGNAYLSFAPGGSYQDHQTLICTNHALVKAALDAHSEVTFVEKMADGAWCFRCDKMIDETTELVNGLNIWKYRRR